MLRDRLTESVTNHDGHSVERTLTYGAATVVATPMPTTTLPDADRVVEVEEHTYNGMTLTDTDTASVSHDLLGRPATVTQDGETLAFQYDSAGRLTGLVDPSTSPPTPVVTQQYGYTGGGGPTRRPARVALPRSNCLQELYYQSHTDDLRPNGAWTQNATTHEEFMGWDLEYRADGRVESEVNEHAAREYTYNAAGRLSEHSESLNDGDWNFELDHKQDTSYDAWGNITGFRRYEYGGSGWSWNVIEGRTFSLSDRMLTRPMGPSASPSHTPTYDARGRVTGDGEYTYAWDVRDRLTSVTRVSDNESWSFVYDARGRLVTMEEGAQTVRLKWRGWTLRGERIEESGETPIERVYRADGMDQGGEHLAVSRDVRGSVTALVLDGERVRTYRYGVWGEQTVVAPGSGLGVYDTHMGFTGHVVHRPTGLVFAPARVYSPRLRQWLTRDPAGERDAVDGRNLYAYVAGDPVNHTDPTGLKLYPWNDPNMLDALSTLWRIPTNVVGAALATADRAVSVTFPGADGSGSIRFDRTPDGNAAHPSRVVVVTGSRLMAWGAGGRTVGNFVFVGAVHPSPLLLRHEYLHVGQHGIFGPYYIPIHLASMIHSVGVSAVEDIGLGLSGQPAIGTAGGNAWYGTCLAQCGRAGSAGGGA